MPRSFAKTLSNRLVVYFHTGNLTKLVQSKFIEAYF